MQKHIQTGDKGSRSASVVSEVCVQDAHHPERVKTARLFARGFDDVCVCVCVYVYACMFVCCLFVMLF